jgi:FtsH-binding integral membrane protein
MTNESAMTETESLRLIEEMIRKAKNSYLETGAGPILWGSVIAVCGLVTFLQLQFQFRLPFDIWLLSMLAVIPQVWMVMKEKKRKKAKGYHDPLMDAVWISFGVAIFLLVFINASIFSKMGPVMKHYAELTGEKPVYTFSHFSTAYFLLLYGIPTIITGVCQRFRAMLWGGIICWICCVASIFTPLATDMLLTALAAVCAWLIPGCLLNRAYHRNKAAHV